VIGGIVGILIGFAVGLFVGEAVLTTQGDWTNILPFVLAVVGHRVGSATTQRASKRKSRSPVPGERSP
jgi:hypothetical protein